MVNLVDAPGGIRQVPFCSMQPWRSRADSGAGSGAPRCRQPHFHPPPSKVRFLLYGANPCANIVLSSTRRHICGARSPSRRLDRHMHVVLIRHWPKEPESSMIFPTPSHFSFSFISSVRCSSQLHTHCPGTLSMQTWFQRARTVFSQASALQLSPSNCESGALHPIAKVAISDRYRASSQTIAHSPRFCVSYIGLGVEPGKGHSVRERSLMSR